MDSVHGQFRWGTQWPLEGRVAGHPRLANSAKVVIGGAVEYVS
jgi:hypothetical protein